VSSKKAEAVRLPITLLVPRKPINEVTDAEDEAASKSLEAGTQLKDILLPNTADESDTVDLWIGAPHVTGDSVPCFLVRKSDPTRLFRFEVSTADAVAVALL